MIYTNEPIYIILLLLFILYTIILDSKYVLLFKVGMYVYLKSYYSNTIQYIFRFYNFVWNSALCHHQIFTTNNRRILQNQLENSKIK